MTCHNDVLTDETSRSVGVAQSSRSRMTISDSPTIQRIPDDAVKAAFSIGICLRKYWRWPD